MRFEPRGQLPEVTRRCAAMKCKLMLPAGKLGKFCDRHRREFMEHGAVDIGPLDVPLRRLYINAVLHRLDHTIKRFPTKGMRRITRAKPIQMTDYRRREMQGTLTDLTQRLSSLPTTRRFNEMRGLSAMEQAEQALAWIVKQMGLEKATVKILAYAVGAFICPKMHGGYRYRTSQVARAVLSLLKSETTKHWATGRPVVKRWPCRGWYFKLALVKFLEKSYFLWQGTITEKISSELRLETHARTLELHGVTARGVRQHIEREQQKVMAAQSTTVARLEEARVGTPVDPNCSSCLEHGWKYGCAIHNTDAEHEAYRRPQAQQLAQERGQTQQRYEQGHEQRPGRGRSVSDVLRELEAREHEIDAEIASRQTTEGGKRV